MWHHGLSLDDVQPNRSSQQKGARSVLLLIQPTGQRSNHELNLLTQAILISRVSKPRRWVRVPSSQPIGMGPQEPINQGKARKSSVTEPQLRICNRKKGPVAKPGNRCKGTQLSVQENERCWPVTCSMLQCDKLFYATLYTPLTKMV